MTTGAGVLNVPRSRSGNGDGLGAGDERRALLTPLALEGASRFLIEKDEVEGYGAVDNSEKRGIRSDSDSSPGGPRTPLPWNQFWLIIFMRLAEPIAYTQIFPVSIMYPSILRQRS